LTSSKGINWDHHVDTGAGYEIGLGWTTPDSGIKVADLDGNDKADIIKKENGILEAYYNTGLTSTKGINWDYTWQTGHGYVVGAGWGMADSFVFVVK
jgi:outer membrane receptor protein involved in Fe transport